MFKVGKFRDAVEYAFTDKNQVQTSLDYALQEKKVAPSNTRELLGEGVNCEVLRIGSNGWQKGKLRIKVSIEFCPDEPEVEETVANEEIVPTESPLDDLRQIMKENK
jgi:hypothetical protein